jgi:hypothetical protein
MEAVADGDGEAREGLFVTMLRPNHQVGIHATPFIGVPRCGPLNTYGRVAARGDSIFATVSTGVLGDLPFQAAREWIVRGPAASGT